MKCQASRESDFARTQLSATPPGDRKRSTRICRVHQRNKSVACEEVREHISLAGLVVPVLFIMYTPTLTLWW